MGNALALSKPCGQPGAKRRVVHKAALSIARCADVRASINVPRRQELLSLFFIPILYIYKKAGIVINKQNGFSQPGLAGISRIQNHKIGTLGPEGAFYLPALSFWTVFPLKHEKSLQVENFDWQGFAFFRPIYFD